MTVSVVIPTHNRRTLVGRALRSISAQTRQPEEVLVIDDGSTDDTAAVIARDFPWTRYVNQVHAGVSAARNVGIRHATGDWIAFLDSDDEWMPTKLERQLDALAREPSYRLCHCDEVWIRAGVRVNPRRRHQKRGGFIFRRCLPLCAISPSAALIERSVFSEIGYFDETLQACEDYDLWLRFCARFPVLFVEERLVVKHGGRTDQLSRRVQALDRYRVRALEKILSEGVLDESDAAAAREMLVEKARIHAEGARKRGRSKEADEFLALAGRHAGCIDDSSETSG